MKLLVLQQWYGPSNYELERQAGDRISFSHILGYPATIPGHLTIWALKNRVIEADVTDAGWQRRPHCCMTVVSTSQNLEKPSFETKALSDETGGIHGQDDASGDPGSSALYQGNRRDRAISRKRALVERPNAVIKRYCYAGYALITTVAHAHVVNVFACSTYIQSSPSPPHQAKETCRAVAIMIRPEK